MQPARIAKNANAQGFRGRILRLRDASLKRSAKSGDHPRQQRNIPLDGTTTESH
jgi:hypothetical protein